MTQEVAKLVLLNPSASALASNVQMDVQSAVLSVSTLVFPAYLATSCQTTPSVSNVPPDVSPVVPTHPAPPAIHRTQEATAAA